MLVWAHGFVFSKLNNLELITSRWWRLRWGAIVRREKRNRLYKNYFVETSLSNRLLIQLQLLLVKKIYNPGIKVLENQSNKIFVFSKRSPDDELFKYLIPHSKEIREEIVNLLSLPMRQKLKNLDVPQIGIHVRRGDFKIGNPITPNKFFIDVITNIREAMNQKLSVTIFTDAREDEISDILQLENVFLASEKEDILDILQMSKSKFLVLSRSSSFSYWAAFLSQAFVIMRYDDWQKQIKPNNGFYYEYRFNENNGNLHLKNTIENVFQKVNQ